MEAVDGLRLKYLQDEGMRDIIGTLGGAFSYLVRIDTETFHEPEQGTGNKRKSCVQTV